ncbi:MAG: hypothetical protein L6W00_11460 [Lentisphaeria bacterium]|nr:MAG: hypothetical protein L6W00_11460 [Lentisphaeria bacterium]
MGVRRQRPGEWEKLRYRRIDLIPWKVDMLRLQLGKRRWSKMNVRTVSFDEKTGVLRIDGERNGFEISHFIRFDARKIPGLLEQEATLRLVNPSTAGKPVPFYSTSFCFPVAKKALLHAPGARGRHRFAPCAGGRSGDAAEGPHHAAPGGDALRKGAVHHRGLHHAAAGGTPGGAVRCSF